MKRVALYCRVSTEEQAIHGLSIDAQTEALEAWAKANEAKVVDHYVDAGISARKPASKRPDLQRLLDDVRSGKIDLIVFTKLDRWFRNIAEYYKVQEVLDDHNVGWKTIHEDYDTTTASGRLKINIMLSVAQDEADRTSERIKVVFDSKRARNEPTNQHVPRGYRIEGKRVKIDEEKAKAVRAALNAYMETGQINKMIAAAPELNLHYQSARAMLKSEAYIGKWCGISIPPIITMDEYRKIHSMNKTIVRKTKNNRLYLFSGLLVCSDCGRRMGGRTSVRTHTETVYYICPGHFQFKGCENGVAVREDTIEQYLLDHIDDEAKRIISFKPQKKRNTHENERNAIKRKLSKLSELYVNDMIAIDDYKRQYDDLTAQLDAIPEDDHIADFNSIQSRFYNGWQEVYRELEKGDKQAFWRLSIKRITFSSSRKITFDFL